MLKLVVSIYPQNSESPHTYTYVYIGQTADLLREGDELLEVNGIPVIGKSTDEIITLMVCVSLFEVFILPI